ncbi:hypothetical protein ABB37_09621 [Leptomonas pyrrhocoris]|uniref:Dymeclin n=1 Tax=Leptomonas pyrrhocoris TaxID=157538 RepID=A0A0M9FPY7_LEPPY|nr:hypothetical protein ABB37_09621 [Leptomonas pyrrhocoris]XP_015652133.1 hypothetical protein ABB37_09621 [Leptomonas pyrrhocoris]XP_015652134.1 hypothetical protein ABB37_09621 [Leptomonas pyrrhocoris]KPA73693.1 hypothetical protein ABB37_09621 [Leptomonas pyrrhocoris]KPA73694.1 hypothetical protein ABB37_09621 [Leptomonas pyrrhocoris]KPA73695.1 hypothetical protein ABB37_09621 [Leptomonas pyrrhocoris]|eukprot:XP_015652132.1 hypothetical protein ABB37_09621 [Leptomonas pyrrhocoris]
MAVLRASTANTTAGEVVGAVAQRGQLRWLLQLCSSVLRGVLEKPNDTVDASAPALLHVTELLLRHVLRFTKAQSAVLVEMFESGGQETAGAATNADGAPAPASSSDDLVKEDAAALLCKTCFAVLLQVPRSSSTVLLHLEVLRLLLTMTSSALHHSTEFREDTMDLFTELMMSSPRLHELLDTLLTIVVEWGKSDWQAPPPLLYHEGCQPSMRNFFQVFGGGGAGDAAGGSGKHSVPYVLDVEVRSNAPQVNPPPSGGAGGNATSSSNGSNGSTVEPKDAAAVLLGSCSCWEQLGRHAAALLCVLVVHQKGGGRNPALEYLAALHDGTPVAFVQLLAVIRREITRYPEMSILLYVLLNDHRTFLHTVLSEDAALFVSAVQQLLELTYKTCKDGSRPGLMCSSSGTCTAAAAAGSTAKPAEDALQPAVLGRLVYHLRIFSYPFINFMSGTLLVLLSQDCVVNRLLCSTPCQPGHLLERYDTSAPVGAFATVVLALGILRGFNERNEALIAVFAPSLVNLAPYVHDMDPYTAQRVSSLLTLVLRKILRAGAVLQAASDEAAGSTEASDLKESFPGSKVSAEEAQALEEIVVMYVRQLRTVIDGVEALLRGADRRNEYLVYELLYARGKIIDDVEAAAQAGRPFAAPTQQLLMGVVEMIRNCEADIASSDQAQNPQEIIAILRRGQRQDSAVAEGADGGNGGGGSSSRNNNANMIEMTSGFGGAGAPNGGDNGAAMVSTTTAATASRSPGPGRNGSDGASVDLVYSYEESPHSYDFFGPFIWSVLLSASRAPGGALWCHHSSELALFPY